MEQIGISFEPERRIHSVAEINARIRALFEREFSDVWVAGEISGVKLSTAGHYYFTLKDESGQLQCACFKGQARYLKFKPQDGVAVIARGRVDVYEPRGTYQLLVEALEPQGLGALQLAFEQLKKRLAAEGLFDTARKRALPALPQRIGIVTSPTGAVIRDLLNVLGRRFPGLHIRLYPAQVQGAGSVDAVCEGIEYFSETGWAEVVIVARGGGSLEDLWTFNEEAVARAIAACRCPVVSAIGHETDFTIADFVADLRAPTPSAAAELVVRTRQELLDAIANTAARIHKSMRLRLAEAHRRLRDRGVDRAATLLHRAIARSMQRTDELDYRLRNAMRDHVDQRRARVQTLEATLRRRDPRLRLADAHRATDAAQARLRQAIALRLAAARQRLAPLAAQLTQLSPLAVLERGYAIVQDSKGRALKDAAGTAAGRVLHVRLANGELDVTVKKTNYSKR